MTLSVFGFEWKSTFNKCNNNKNAITST